MSGVIAAAGAPSLLPRMPTSGLLAAWEFAEGSGSTVADISGNSQPINLNLPTSPNYSWAAGPYISLAGGLVQTPTINNARTIAFLYQVDRNEAAGFLISGGAAANVGWQWNNSNPETDLGYIGGVNGVNPIYCRSNGAQADVLVSGGWKVGFRTLSQQYNSPFGFGGRYGATTNRCTTYNIAAASIWSGVLDSNTKLKIYNYYRRLAKLRGVYIDYRDCPIQYDGVILIGESTADGRAAISDLSAGDQARSLSRTQILACNHDVQLYPPAALVLGTNQQATSPAVQFGPEIGLAWGRQAGARSTPMVIAKIAQGSTYLAPSSTGISVPSSWNPVELPTSGPMIQVALKWMYHCHDYYLNANIGVSFSNLLQLNGLNDAMATTYAPDSATVQANAQSLYSAFRQYTGWDPTWIVAQAHSPDAVANTTALANVRAGLSAFVAANPKTQLLGTDGYSLKADGEHFDGNAMTGTPKLGQDAYALFKY